jgi:TetR/AcrR family transcriptional regulator
MSHPADNIAAHKSGIRRANVTKILDAAERVFAVKGFNGASVGMIAESAKVPKPNVYYYFGTKEDLYRRVIEDVCSTWLHAADLFDETDDPAVAIRAYVETKMDLARARPNGSRLWAIEMASGAPFLTDYLENTVRPWLESREKVLQKWIDQGRLKPMSTRYFFYMIWATTQNYADFEAQINIMNEGQPLSDEQFEHAKKCVTEMIIHAVDIA